MWNKKGFTLVELLVVMTVLIILTILTLHLVNVTVDEDRVRSAAGSVQSFLEGARDRAIHAKEPRGVRFIRDTLEPDVVTSMLYIGSPKSYSEGQIQIGTDKRAIQLVGRANWANLYSRKLISPGSVLRIGNQNLLFTIQIALDGMGNPQFSLTKDYEGPPQLGTPYSLQLAPTVLPNQEPRQFPRDVVIDLDNSKIPSAWSSDSLDILFSPHGTVTGLVASEGVVNLVVAERVDVSQGRKPGAQDKEGNERVVSIRTQTGGISVHHIDPTDADSNGMADDPFRYAASGDPAK